MDYITPIQSNLEHWMHKMCETYIIMGTPEESPRWFNLKEIDHNNRTITISSTQELLGFTIPVPEDYPLHHLEDNREFWAQFKTFRTQFLTTYYSTIKTS